MNAISLRWLERVTREGIRELNLKKCLDVKTRLSQLNKQEVERKAQKVRDWKGREVGDVSRA